MPATYRSTAFAANTAGTDVSSVTVSKPSGVVDGDGMIAIVAGFQSGSGVSAPAGWTAKQSNVTSSTGLRLDIYTKIASSEGSTYQFSRLSGSGAMSAVIIAIEDISADWESTLWTSAADNGTSTSATPSFTSALNAGELFFSGVAFWRNGTESASGSAGWTEIQDFVRQDGAPGTNWRGQAVYRCNSVTAGGGTPAANTITLANTPAGQIEWAVSVASRVEVTSGSVTHSGATASGNMTAADQPTINGALTHSGATAAGEAYEWPTVDGAVLHTGALADGVAYEYPTLDGAVELSGATAAGSGYEWPTLDGALLHSGATASGEVEVGGTKLEIKINGSWVDITTSLRHHQGVTITRGRSSSGQSMTTTRCTFTLDNRGHQFSPFNPNGTYYGYLTRNTEVRMTKQETGVRFHGELSSYTFGTDRSGNDLIVDIECAGLLRRLEQGESPVGSPLYREITSAATPAAVNYWPCEDEGGNTLKAALGGNQATPLETLAARIRSGHSELSSYEDFKCSEGLPQVGTAQWVFPQITSAEINSSDGVTVSFLLASPGGLTNGTTLLTLQGNDDDGTGWELFTLKYSATNTLQLVRETDGGSTTISGTTKLVGEAGVMVFISLVDTNPIGGSFAMALWAQGPEDSEPTLLANSVSGGSISSAIAIKVNPTLAALNESSSVYMGHFAAWATHASTSGDVADLPSFASLNAYLGERAGTRFERLCGEEGITFEGTGTMADSVRMGYQTSKSFVELLRECEETDQGMMYEIRDDLGLGYRTGRSFYNDTATATFDYTGGHLLDELKPIYDDKDIRNEVTVTREGGSSATYEKSTGPMSTLAVPDGVGRYDDAITVSLHTDADAYVQAGWRVHKGTVDEIRVQSISTGLEVPEIQADGVLEVALLTLDVGHRVIVENTPAWMPVDDVDQVIQGYTERWDPTEHRFSFNTDPASPYRIARLTAAATSTTQAKLGGARQARLSGAIGTGATSITVNFDGMSDTETGATSIWRAGAEDFDIIIGGERMTVTSVSNPGGDQATATVTRSVNGIVKGHADTAEIYFYRPAKLGL